MNEPVDAEAGLQCARDGHVLRLTLDRPQAGNSLSRALMAQLEHALRGVADDPGIRAVVLTGAGDRIFCGGADLSAPGAFQFEDQAPAAPFARVLRALRAVDVPVIARVNGSAAGGGVGLLGLCDFVIASEQALFVVSEINIGLFPTQVVSALQRALPRARLIRMCMLGEKIDARQAEAIGLVGEVVPAAGLDAAVEGILAQLLSKSPTAMRRGKYLLRAIESMSFEESLCLTETLLRVQAADPNTREGLAAFREKRTPQWT